MEKGIATFSSKIFPGFPFRNNDWVAIAFERDNYTNVRLPEWFFRAAQELLDSSGEIMLIKGYGEIFDRAPGGVITIPFDWIKFETFMLAPENYSPEYQIEGSKGDWAFWADPELSVWGGHAVIMEKIFDRFGGKQKILISMLKDFYISDIEANAQLYSYLRHLVFR